MPLCWLPEESAADSVSPAQLLAQNAATKIQLPMIGLAMEALATTRTPTATRSRCSKQDIRFAMANSRTCRQTLIETEKSTIA